MSMYHAIIEDALYQTEPVLAGFTFDTFAGELIRQAVEVGLTPWINPESESFWFSRSPEIQPHCGCIRL